MKTIVIKKADIRISTSSEIFLNWELLAIGQCFYNLYDKKEIIYRIKSVGIRGLLVEVYEAEKIIKEIEIGKEVFNKTYHWYFYNNKNYIFIYI